MLLGMMDNGLVDAVMRAVGVDLDAHHLIRVKGGSGRRRVNRRGRRQQVHSRVGRDRAEGIEEKEKGIVGEKKR